MKFKALLSMVLIVTNVFAERHERNLSISTTSLCGGVKLGSSSLKPKQGLKYYTETVEEHGYESEKLGIMLDVDGRYYVKPQFISIDGETKKSFKVSGKYVCDQSTLPSNDSFQRMKTIADSLNKLFGIELYTSRKPALASHEAKIWIGRFVDNNKHTCYVLLSLCQQPAKSGDTSDTSFQDYEQETKAEIWVSVFDVDYANETVRCSIEQRYEEAKRKASTPFTAKELYMNVQDCIAVLDDYHGRKSTGFLARAEGQVYLYTSRHIPQPTFNQFSDPLLSATTINGKHIWLGRLQIPLFKGDEYDVARYELKSHDTCDTHFDCDIAIDLDERVEVNVGDKVFIFGNSDANDVITTIEGKVLGVGPTKIEVDAKFVPGNSGGPVFNENGQIIGIVSYIHTPKKTSLNYGTVFSERRYFIARLDCLELGFRNDWWRVSKDRNNHECRRRRDLEAIKKSF